MTYRRVRQFTTDRAMETMRPSNHRFSDLRRIPDSNCVQLRVDGHPVRTRATNVCLGPTSPWFCEAVARDSGIQLAGEDTYGMQVWWFRLISALWEMMERGGLTAPGQAEGR